MRTEHSQFAIHPDTEPSPRGKAIGAAGGQSVQQRRSQDTTVHELWVSTRYSNSSTKMLAQDATVQELWESTRYSSSTKMLAQDTTVQELWASTRYSSSTKTLTQDTTVQELRISTRSSSQRRRSLRIRQFRNYVSVTTNTSKIERRTNPTLKKTRTPLECII